MASAHEFLVPILMFFTVFFFLSTKQPTLQTQLGPKKSEAIDNQSQSNNPKASQEANGSNTNKYESEPHKPYQPKESKPFGVSLSGDVGNSQKSTESQGPNEPEHAPESKENKETDDSGNPDITFTVGPRDKRGIDVVVVALQPTCTDKDVVAGLLNYLDPVPKSIIYISKQVNCKVYSSLHPSVSCVNEDKLIPGMNFNKIKEVYHSLHAHHHQNTKRKFKILRHGWYFQQYLKWGSIVHLNVTDWTLIWDSDMVLVRPYKVLDQDRKIHYFDQGGFPGNAYKLHYEELLPGQIFLRYFVPHHMVMYRPILIQLMHTLYAAGTNRKNVPVTVNKITAGEQQKRVPPDWWWRFLNYTRNWEGGQLFEGWSEYGFYSAFVHQNYPELAQDVQSKWSRDAKDPGCCPDLTLDKQRGVSYVGVERGYPHRRWQRCHDHPEEWKIHP